MAMSAALGVVLSVITALVLRPTAALPAAIVFTVVSCIVVAVDLARRDISRRALGLAVAVVILAQGFGALSVDQPARLLGALAGGVVAFLAVMTFHLVSPESPTRDEVVYAALVGTTLGWFGLDRVGLGLGLGLVIGAVSAGPQVLVGRRRAGDDVVDRPVTATFAPAMALGGWIALCWGESILSWYSSSQV